jgi:hypothetical protein
MLTDPMAVTYNGNAKSLVRTSVGRLGTRYRTADGEFEATVSSLPLTVATWDHIVSIELSRYLPDPTPADAFDAYRKVGNSFGIFYRFDRTRAETSVDVPLLRTALLAFVDTTIQGRLIAGEK